MKKIICLAVTNSANKMFCENKEDKIIEIKVSTIR